MGSGKKGDGRYYPFGLTMAGISDKAIKSNYAENKYKFTGQLYDDDLGWDTYQMKYRTMDPQVGRFWQVDPLATKYVYNSTYDYAENRVINGIDQEGKEFWRMALGIMSGNPDQTNQGLTGMFVNLQNDANGAMQGSYRLASGTDEHADSHLPVQVQPAISAANKADDVAATAQPAVDVLQTTATLASTVPVGGAGLPAAAVEGAAAFSLESAPQSELSLGSSQSSVSPKVQDALNTFNDLKANGATVQPNALKGNQELNLSIFHDGSQLNLRVETHDLPTSLGGNGKGDPVRHMNVELSPGGKNLPNAGHIILK